MFSGSICLQKAAVLARRTFSSSARRLKNKVPEAQKRFQVTKSEETAAIRIFAPFLTGIPAGCSDVLLRSLPSTDGAEQRPVWRPSLPGDPSLPRLVRLELLEHLDGRGSLFLVTHLCSGAWRPLRPPGRSVEDQGARLTSTPSLTSTQRSS